MKVVIKQSAVPLTHDLVLNAISNTIYNGHVAKYGEEPRITSERSTQNGLDGTYFIEDVNVVQNKLMRNTGTRDHMYAIRYFGTIGDRDINDMLAKARYDLLDWLRFLYVPSHKIDYIDDVTGEESSEIVDLRVVGSDMNANGNDEDNVMSVYVTYQLRYFEDADDTHMRTLKQTETIKEG